MYEVVQAHLHVLVVCMSDYQVSLLCMGVGSDEEEMAEEEEKEALALQQRLAEQFDEQAYLAPEKSVSLPSTHAITCPTSPPVYVNIVLPEEPG